MEEISWEEAYKTIASRVMDIIKNMTTDQPSHLLLQKVFRKLSLNISQDGGFRQCGKTPHTVSFFCHSGFSSVFGTYPDADLPNTKFVIMSGANRAESIYTPDTIDIAKKHKRSGSHLY